ncbi:MAG: hypothetical protein P1V18_04665 [Candidatus Gracilibacteria bacterium]|nr:hypothetical protein [Candidatus Gracilibacteria bacterium]
MNNNISDTPPKNGNYLTQRMVALGIKEDHPDIYENLQREIHQRRTTNQVRADVGKILDSYEKKQSDHKAGHWVVYGAGKFIAGTLAVGGMVAAPATFGASLVLEGVAFGINETMDLILDEYDSDAEKSSKAVLVEALRALKSNGEDLNKLKDLKPSDVVVKALSAQSTSVPTIDLDKVDKNGQLYLNHHMMKQFSLLKGIDDLNSFIDDQPVGTEDEIQKKAEQVGIMGGSLVKYQKVSNARFDDVQKSIEKVDKGLKDLSIQVGENADGIAFIKEVMYGKMSPHEQLAALKNGKIKLPNQEAEIKAKQILVDRMDFADKANKFLNGTQIVATLASDLGILKPEVAKKVNQAVAAGSAILNGTMSIMSGNYLGALQSLGSLVGVFKKKGPSPAEMRHKQIMARFAALQSGQQQIMKNQEKLFNGQKKMMELQVEMFNTIITFANIVEKKFQYVILKLAEIHQDILVNRGLIVEIMNEDIYAGELFLLDRFSDEEFDAQKGYFTSYEAMQAFFESNVDNFQRGVRALEDIRSIRGKVDPRLLLESYKITPKDIQLEEKNDEAFLQKNTVGEYIEKVYLPTLSLLSLTEKSGEVISSLLCPVSNTDSVFEKLKVADPVNPNKNLLSFISKNLKKPLSTDALLKTFEFLIESQVYIQLVDHMGTPDGLMSVEEVFKKNRLRTRGRDRIKEALSLVDLSIVQQSLVSGEPFFERIFDEIDKALQAPDTDGHDVKYSVVWNALKYNGNLRRNFVIYLTHKKTYEDGNNDRSLLYSTQLNYKERSEGLKRYFGEHYRFEYSPNKDEVCPWLIVFPAFRKGKKSDKEQVIKVRLPSIEELQSGQLEHQNDLSELVNLRNRMTDAIVSYDMMEESTGREKQMLVDLTFSSASKS